MRSALGDLLVDSKEVLSKVNQSNFREKLHVVEDISTERDPFNSVISYEDNRKKSSRKETKTKLNFSEKGRPNKYGVRGVHQNKFPDGRIYWQAKICKAGILTTLYTGLVFSEAVEARKKAEKELVSYEISSVKKSDVLPVGVRMYVNNGINNYTAHGHSKGKTISLYHGKSPEQAIYCRRKWEKENGFEGANGKKVYPSNVKTSRNKTGVVGVCLSKGRWWATCQRFGIKYTLYYGPSKDKAVKARERWNKDHTITKCTHVKFGAFRAKQVYGLISKHKKVTSGFVASNLGLSVTNASSVLNRMVKKGYLIRTVNPSVNNGYFYTKSET